jgi:hypothetical protein
VSLADQWSPQVQREVATYERRQDLALGSVSDALELWRRAVAWSTSSGRASAFHDCDCGEPPTYWYRDVLEAALHGLSPSAKRVVAAQVRQLDDAFEEATSPDPLARQNLSWWLRRFPGYPTGWTEREIPNPRSTSNPRDQVL